MDKQVYQRPTVVEIGSFAELTLGSPFGIQFELGAPPFNKFF